MMARWQLCFVGVLCTGWLVTVDRHLHAVEAAPSRNQRGVVFVVGGVGGTDPLGVSTERALPLAGVDDEVQDFVWTHGYGRVLLDLQDFRYLQDRGHELAGKIRQIKQQDPNRPVYLLGKSGGSEIVLAAAEQLPPGTLERIVLISPAVAPQHDLRPALRATKKELVCFHSRWDTLILGWGTTHFGTADRYYGPSAGIDGFIIPDNIPYADRLLYHRLVQIPWRPRMMLEGNFGRHYGSSNPLWVRREVAPWLKP